MDKIKEPRTRQEFTTPARIKEKLRKLANRDTNGSLTKKYIQLVEEAK